MADGVLGALGLLGPHIQRCQRRDDGTASAPSALPSLQVGFQELSQQLSHAKPGSRQIICRRRLRGGLNPQAPGLLRVAPFKPHTDRGTMNTFSEHDFESLWQINEDFEDVKLVVARCRAWPFLIQALRGPPAAL